jgi:uncharacterized membrane protein
MRRFLWGRRRDERGATLIFTAISMVALLGAGAMGVDVGFSVYGSREAQALADTGALDMARYLDMADSYTTAPAVQSYLNGKLAQVDADNGSNATLTVTPGLWSGGAWSVPGYGCFYSVPAFGPPCNAVMVSASQAVPQIFWGGFNSLSGHGSAARGSSVAAVTPESAFSIGSYPTSMNTQQTAVLNDILSTIGTSASVTAVGYQGLADTFVTVNQLVTASGGLLTTSNVLTTSLTASQWLAIWSDAVANQVALLNCGASPTPAPCNASAALGALDFSGSGSTAVQLCQLVSVNGSSCASGTLSTPALSASLDALQLLTAEAEVANGSSPINVTSALSLTVSGLSISQVQLVLQVVQPARVAYGAVGSYTSPTSPAQCPAPSGQTSTCATTAQVTSDLRITLPSFGLLDIPLSAAQGTATLSTTTCNNNALFKTNINATTTAANSGTNGVTLAGTGVATLSIGSSSPIMQSPPFGASVVPPTASTESLATNPRNLSGAPTFSFSGVSGTLNASVNTLLTSVVPGAYGPVLQAAGVQVGGAQVADLSTNCDAVSLVQ